MLIPRPTRLVFVCALAAMLLASKTALAQEGELSPPPTSSPGPAPTPEAAAKQEPKAPPAPEGNAPAEGEAKPEEKKPIAAYVQGEGFRILSEDGNFKLRVGLQWAGKYSPVWNNDVDEPILRSPFYVVRLRVDGHLFRPWIRYWTSVETAANPPYLLDSYTEIQPIPEVGFRLGQQFTPLSRHEYLGPQEILFPDWNVVAEYFWTGRDKGATLYGAIGDNVIEYWAGIYSGSPLRQFKVIPGNWETIGRVTVSPMGTVGPTEFEYMIAPDPLPLRVSFTVQGWIGDIQSATENFNGTSGLFNVVPTGEKTKLKGAAADVLLQGPRFSAFAEGYVRKSEPEGVDSFVASGAWAQIGVAIIDKTLGFALRGSYIDPSDDVKNDRMIAGEVQVAYYVVAPNVVAKLRYGIADQDEPTGDLGAATLPASPGTSHIITLQLNLSF